MSAASERLKRWRDAQRAAGNCVNCTRKALPGLKRCRSCRNAQREVQAKYRENCKGVAS